MKTFTLELTEKEIRAALNAMGQQTAGNSYDFPSWKSGTSGTMHEWKALVRAESKMEAALRSK